MSDTGQYLIHLHNARKGQYLIYLRKSRKDREFDELGIDVLDRHKKTLLELAKKMNLPIAGIYEELVSGDSISARPEMQKLIREVESGKWAGVLVMEVERLARGDTIDQGVVSRAFQYSDTLIITPAKTYDPTNEYDQEYFEFGLFMSRREYKTITRRMQAGRLRSVQDGFYVGNIPPYGYDRVKAPDKKHFTLTPNEEADTVRLIFDLYANKQYGFDKICVVLNNMGIKPRRSDRFTAPTIKDIVGNPVYIGMLRWNRRKQEKSIVNGTVTLSRPKSIEYDVYRGIHPPLISKELYDAANSRRGYWTAPVRKSHTLQNPLAGLFVCPECGRQMIRKPKSGRQTYDTIQCATTGCKTVSCKFDVVESALLKKIEEMVSGYAGEDVSSVHEAAPDFSALLTEKKKELEEIEKQRLNVYDLLERGLYTEAIFLERQKALANKKLRMEKEIESLTVEMQIQEALTQKMHEFIPQCEKLLKEYRFLDTEQKNKALKLIIKQVTYHKTQRGQRGCTLEDTFDLKITPIIPSFFNR